MADPQDTSSAEVWKTIPGFEGSFEASTHGRIKALRRFSGLRWYDERILKLIPLAHGYLKANLSFNNKVHQRKVHQLILETFVGPCPKGLQCLHGDGNPRNNRLSNLKWGTATQNADDRRRHGTIAQGERHGWSKLTPAKVRSIRKMLAEGRPQIEVSRHHRIANSVVHGIAHGKGWTHVV